MDAVENVTNLQFIFDVILVLISFGLMWISEITLKDRNRFLSIMSKVVFFISFIVIVYDGL